MDPIKKFMIKDHEKFVTASYPQLIARGFVINFTGLVALYVGGVILWKAHSRMFKTNFNPDTNPNLTTIEND